MPDSLPLVTLYLSERCNSRCVTCDYWRHGVKDMTLPSVRRLLPELAALRTRAVLLSGGEPLLNPEWREIGELLASRGLTLWLLTSGLSLAKHSLAAARLFDSITVSLDGTCAETYAAIRGLDAFDKVCDGIRAVAAAGRPAGLRVTLQRSNYRELVRFVTLARELGAASVSFLAVDVSNGHAFARRDASPLPLALGDEDIATLERLIEQLEREHAEDFKTGFIAESPAKLRRIRDYFAALRGGREFPAVRCNAPEFSAVIAADGRVAPCFFIPGPAQAPRAPISSAALASEPMRALRRRRFARASGRNASAAFARCGAIPRRSRASRSRTGPRPMLDASLRVPARRGAARACSARSPARRCFSLTSYSARHRYDDFRLERVVDLANLRDPRRREPESVAHRRVLRRANRRAAALAPGAAVLDMGTGSGVCALAAARRARRVVAVDVNPAAVRCARLNALLNDLEERIDVREGDLFAPLDGERFDLVLFNPPFLIGAPKDHRDAAWRSEDCARRFAAGLGEHLNAGRRRRCVLLSSFGDACALFEAELRANGFRLDVFARRRYINETVDDLACDTGRPRA